MRSDKFLGRVDKTEGKHRLGASLTVRGDKVHCMVVD